MENKILIIDDEPSVREAIKFLLEKNGYEVIIASDGEEGLVKVNSEHPDLIILDVVMPGKNGFEVLRELRENTKIKWHPVIMLTVKDHPKDVMEGYKFEADYYIAKPFDKDKLLRGIKTLLALRPLRGSD